jgi:YvrJ protein family
MDTAAITTVDALIAVIGNFGFPLVLATYLLLRFEKKLESLTEAINHLQEVMKK